MKNIKAVLNSLRVTSPQKTRPDSSSIAAACSGTPSQSVVVQLSARGRSRVAQLGVVVESVCQSFCVLRRSSAAALTGPRDALIH